MDLEELKLRRKKAAHRRRRIIFDNDGNVLKSTDTGANWRIVSTLGPQVSVTGIGSLAVDPRSSQTLYASTRGGIYKSLDGGLTWQSPTLLGIADIVDLLDRLTLGANDEAFRVLVVDDDAEVTRHTEIVLRAAGMITAGVDDPMKIMEPLEEFRPELILVSAGFDAHARDPLASLLLSEDDYAWITRELCAVAGEFCDGRLVATLEGGYDLEALAASVAAHVHEMMSV